MGSDAVDKWISDVREWANDHPDVLMPERLTIRDWFAGMALSGAMESEIRLVEAGGAAGGASDTASICYELADAMLAEREKRDG